MQENDAKAKEWREILMVPRYMVGSISDAGTYERWVDNEKFEIDDLRMSILTKPGYEILIPGNGRLVIDHDGDVHIEILIDENN